MKYPNQKLYDAIVKNDFAAAKQALRDGADINSQEMKTKETFLHQAAKTGKTEFVNFLLERGIDLFLEDDHNQTAADVASSTEIKDLIQKYETAINGLFVCAKDGNIEELKELLKQELPRKIVAFNKWGLLLTAASSENKDVVEL
ncbi:MAG: ankyrin repeat domain-containing protein [Alphaproteobacteria bacterium]|jgi:ankyrin repeat protein|nr:ankyrin repeat domain-containing protein [Candidatus Jidaibacter sp.]